MALGKRYTFGFYDRQDRHITAEIFREGYTGTAEAVAEIGKPALVITKGKPTDYVLEPVKASRAVVRLLKTEILQYLNFFSSDFRNSRLDIYVDGTMYWRGWCLPDVYSEPFLKKTVALSFVDGLILLKDVDYDQTGVQTLWDIIRYSIEYIGLGIPVHSGCSIREDSISTVSTVEPLEQITFDAAQFDKESYYDVLTTLLEKHGLRIYQQNATWIIEQIGDKVTGETIRKYNYGYYPVDSYYDEVLDEIVYIYEWGYSLDSVELQNNLITAPQTSGGIVQFLARNANIEMVPGWKSFKLKDVYGLKESIIGNHDFSNYSEIKTWYPAWGSLGGHYRYIGEFENWQCTDDLDLFVRWFDGNQYMSLLNITDDITGASVSSHYVSNIIKPTLVADNDQQLRIQFDYLFEGLYSTGVAHNLYFMVKCGSNYMQADGSWTTTENIVDLGAIYPAYRERAIQTVDIPTEKVVAGDIEVRFYLPYINDAAWIYYWSINNLKVTLLTSTSESYVAELAETVVINESNNFIGDDKEFKMIDLPAVSNAKAMCANGLKLTDGTPTDNWNYQGMSGTLSELFIYQLVQNYHKLKAKITGAGFFGDGAGFNNIFAISGLSNRRFMFTNYTHDLYRSTIEGAQLVELPFIAELSNASAYFFAQYGDNLLNLKGSNATVNNGYIVFPNVANDIFNKQNTTFWQSGLTIHDSDPRKWAFSELTGTAVILYSTATCRARLFFRDYDSATIDSILPIMAFNTDRTAAEQQEIVESLAEYFFIIDGGFIIQDDSDYVITP